MSDLLNLRTLRASPAVPELALPPRGWESQAVGIVHLGIGAFHRAHQAVYTQDAFALTGDDRWAISGVTQRSSEVKTQQDCLYGVMEGADRRPKLTIVGSVREVLYAAEDGFAFGERLSSDDVQVVTMTITEKAYLRDAAGALDFSHPLVAVDLQSVAPPVTAIGRLVAGLRQRADRSGAALTVVCCDNLMGNGRVVEQLVGEFCRATGADDLADWIGTHVTFPSTMVDRIVPATTAADRDRARSILGLQDRGLVVAEQFKQWVVEDHFAAERPLWETAGAQLVSDVAPFERMKLLILNGAHSALAYLGAIRGHHTIADAIADPELEAFIQAMLTEDVIPALEPPAGVDLAEYAARVLARFSDVTVAHRTTQIAMDGSQKLPLRLLSTLSTNLERGKVSEHVLRAVAGWMAYIALPEGPGGFALPVEDPLGVRLTTAARGQSNPARVVDALLGIREIFSDDLSANQAVRACLIDSVRELLRTEEQLRVASACRRE